MKKLISEDQAIQNTQKLVGTSGNAQPKANPVRDLLAANKKDTNYTAPQPKPYPLNMSDEILSDMYVASMNIRKILDQVGENPALKDKYKGTIKSLKAKIDFVNKALVDISGEIDTIV